jgi:hypothetical protein
MNPASWQNLGLAALISMYATLTLLPVINGQTLEALGSDYRAFWGAGYIANRWGYAEIYNIQRLSDVQLSLTPQISPDDFYPIPAPYFPIFLMPFQLLALIPAKVSFWLWEIINVVGMVLYLRFFIQRYDISTGRNRPILLVMLFMPVFNNLWWGQPGLWLMICAGEFFWSMQKQNFFRAGIWMSGLILKPQLLLLILPALVLQGAWRSLFGFIISAGVLGIISLALIGINGLHNYVSLMLFWGKADSDLQAINPLLMINWRMFGLHLGRFLTPDIGWIVAIAGTVITVLASLRLWRKPMDTSGEKFAFALFGLLVATCAITWHSHQHSLMIAIPTFVFLSLKNRITSTMQNYWLFLLPASWLLSIFIGILMRYGIIPQIDAIGGFVTGTAGLALSLYSLAWANKQGQRIRF